MCNYHNLALFAELIRIKVILPLVYQQAGWLTPTLAILITFVLSSYACTMLCEAMQMIPGNRNFEKR